MHPVLPTLSALKKIVVPPVVASQSDVLPRDKTELSPHVPHCTPPPPGLHGCVRSVVENKAEADVAVPECKKKMPFLTDDSFSRPSIVFLTLDLVVVLVMVVVVTCF